MAEATIIFTSHNLKTCTCNSCIKIRIDKQIDKRFNKFLPSVLRNFLHDDANINKIFTEHQNELRLISENKYEMVNASFRNQLARKNRQDIKIDMSYHLNVLT